jgi:hypothetical protein
MADATPPKAPNVPADVTPEEFLLAVLRDPTQPLGLRNHNAEVLLPYTKPKLIAVAAWAHTEMPTITITGGLPALPGTNTVMPPTIVTRAAPQFDSEPEPEPPQFDSEPGPEEDNEDGDDSPSDPAA